MLSAPLTRPAVRFEPGRRTWSALHVSGHPLGYRRSITPVTAPLPDGADPVLVEQLAECARIRVAFAGGLGDALLALSAVRALWDWCALNRRENMPALTWVGPYADLLRTAVLGPPPSDHADGHHGADLLVGDHAGLRLLDHGEAGPRPAVLCDPAAPPCRTDGWYAHPDLPARHYLHLERRLGQRLPGEAPFAPRLLASIPTGDPPRAPGLLAAAVTATSRPDRKDAGTALFISALDHVAEHLDLPVRLIVIGGKTTRASRLDRIRATPRVTAVVLDGAALPDLAALFPTLDLVVGNDTGLTHLAALATAADRITGPPVIGLYARHSHGKWRTGWPHHHALATGFSDWMHRTDRCPVRDDIDKRDYPPTGDLAAITSLHVAQAAIRVLDLETP